jgi:hypothetical protein
VSLSGAEELGVPMRSGHRAWGQIGSQTPYGSSNSRARRWGPRWVAASTGAQTGHDRRDQISRVGPAADRRGGRRECCGVTSMAQDQIPMDDPHPSHLSKNPGRATAQQVTGIVEDVGTHSDQVVEHSVFPSGPDGNARHAGRGSGMVRYFSMSCLADRTCRTGKARTGRRAQCRPRYGLRWKRVHECGTRLLHSLRRGHLWAHVSKRDTHYPI